MRYRLPLLLMFVLCFVYNFAGVRAMARLYKMGSIAVCRLRNQRILSGHEFLHRRPPARGQRAEFWHLHRLLAHRKLASGIHVEQEQY